MYINVELWHDSLVGVPSRMAFEQLVKNMHPRSLQSVAVICLHLLFSLARRAQCLSLKRQKNLQYNYRLFTLLCQQPWIISSLMVWLSEVRTEQSNVLNMIDMHVLCWFLWFGCLSRYTRLWTFCTSGCTIELRWGWQSLHFAASLENHKKTLLAQLYVFLCTRSHFTKKKTKKKNKTRRRVTSLYKSLGSFWLE